MKYLPRIADNILKDNLRLFGAVQISGPKYCGKTETAKQQANSRINLQTDASASIAMSSDPNLLLLGDKPRLIDEWQEYPLIRNVVRHEVDELSQKGLFILTGSSTPSEESEAKLHSGAGRIARMRMRTMTWAELGWSSSVISLANILKGNRIKSSSSELSVQEIIKRLVIGGWPAYVNDSESVAAKKNKAYLDNIIESDIRRFGEASRDPARVRKVFESYARNISTPAKITTIQSDTSETEISRKTISEYIADLTRLMIIDDLAAWNIHIRSSAKLRATPKRYLADTSLAVAALNLNSDSLIKDLNYVGFLFESQAVHDLRIYAEALDSQCYYYRDSDGDEVDLIIENRNGKFSAFEIKLGIGSVEEAANSLNRFKEKLTDKKKADLVSMNIIVGSGFASTTPEGINIIPLNLLGL